MIESHHTAVMYSQYRLVQFPPVFGPWLLVHLCGNAQHRFGQPRHGKLGEFSGTLKNLVLITWAGMLFSSAGEAATCPP